MSNHPQHTTAPFARWLWLVRRNVRVRWAFALVVACFSLLLLSPVSSAQADAGRFDGKVIFMRHALAPGFGDPDNFDIKDCSTQRNLDETGRKQARAIGKRLRDSGIKFGAIYSSYWCRCLETAQLLALGPVRPFSGLNSFFQSYAPRQETLAKLKDEIASLPKDGKPILMVTHFVTISAITGLGVNSGEMAMLDLETGNSRAISLAAFGGVTN